MDTQQDISDKTRFLPLVYRALQEAHMKREGHYLHPSEITREMFSECYSATVDPPHYHVVDEWKDIGELSQELDDLIDLREDPVTQEYCFYDGQAYRLYAEAYRTSPMVKPLNVDKMLIERLMHLQWSAGYYTPQGTIGFLMQEGDTIWATDEENIEWIRAVLKQSNAPPFDVPDLEDSSKPPPVPTSHGPSFTQRLRGFIPDTQKGE